MGLVLCRAPHVHLMHLKGSEGLVRMIGSSYAISESMQLNEDRLKILFENIHDFEFSPSWDGGREWARFCYICKYITLCFKKKGSHDGLNIRPGLSSIILVQFFYFVLYSN